MGAGSVGATIAYACMVRGVGKHISLFDRVRAKVEAEVLDLNHGLMFVPMAKLDGSDDIAVLEHSDVIVVTAGAKAALGNKGRNFTGVLVFERLCTRHRAVGAMVVSPALQRGEIGQIASSESRRDGAKPTHSDAML